MKAQGQSLDDLPFKAIFGVWGSWFGLIMNIMIIVAQFYVAIFPIGGFSATGFFQAILAAPIIAIFYGPFKWWNSTRFVRARRADLLTGRRELDLAALKEEERIERESWGIFKKYTTSSSTELTSRVYYFLC